MFLRLDLQAVISKLAAHTDAHARIGRDVALVAGVVFAASLFGVLTRPVGFLAALWPANALLLGLFVRNPRLAESWGWAAAIAGYVAAAIVAGDDLYRTFWLTFANLVFAATGYILFQLVREEDRRLGRPLSVLILFLILLASAALSGFVGAGVSYYILGRDPLIGLTFWFTTELVNAIIIIPVILTAPPLHDLRKHAAAAFAMPERKSMQKMAPALFLAFSILCAQVVGGPGAIAFTVPALLWCSLAYSLFTTVVVTMLTCAWQLIAISLGWLAVPPLPDVIHSTMSIRIGVTLLALGPLTVASINVARNELIRRLDRAASHDGLTGVLSRGSFLDHGRRLLSADEFAPAAILMADVDHFKSVNDRYGHVAGDRALVVVAETMTRALREGDLLGRMGGEEFAIVLRNAERTEAMTIAERIRAEVDRTPVVLENGQSFHVTLSIGMAFRERGSRGLLEPLLSQADNALYDAKRAGRNQVAIARQPAA